MRLLASLLLVASSMVIVPSASLSLRGVDAPYEAPRAAAEVCEPPTNALQNWYYYNETTYKKLGPFNCTDTGDARGKWAMLNAYRSGGMGSMHWKWTLRKNDKACLVDWTYYSKNGQKVIAHIKGRATQKGDWFRLPWCALPVYRTGGVRSKQWEYCTCSTRR